MSLYVLSQGISCRIIKCTALACFIVKYLEHECNVDMPIPLPDGCGWCGYPVITAVGLDLGFLGGPLSAPDRGGPLAPFLSCFAWCWVSRLANGLVSSVSPCPLGGPVEGPVSLRWM